MIRYADPTRCPDCASPLPDRAAACPGCGLRLTGSDAVELFRTLLVADRLLARLRQPDPAPATAPAPPLAVAPEIPVPQPSPAARPRGLSGASVPKILLGLGALCLLVAAVIFLAVAWTWLGVGGRTAVLVTFTVIAGGTAAWLGRRGLRIAAESLSVVAFGLLGLDVVGADNAGWLGELSPGGLVAVTGLVVGGTALALAWVTSRGGQALLAPQVVAALGLGVVPTGLSGTTGHDAAVVALSCTVLLALAGLAHVLRIGILPWILTGVAAFWWLSLAGLAVERLATDGTWEALWLELDAWPAVYAAGLLLVVAGALRAQAVVPEALVGIAATLLTLTATFPLLSGDTPDATRATTTLLGCVSAWALVLLGVPARWRVSPTVPLLAAGLPAAAVGADLMTSVLGSLLGVAAPWSSDASLRLVPADTGAEPWLLLAGSLVACLAAVALARYLTDPWEVARRYAPFGAVLAGLGALLTLAAYAVPLALVPAGLVLIAAGLLTWALPRPDGRGRAGLALALALGLAALGTALPSVALTLSTAVVVLAAAVLVAARGALPVLRLWAETVVPPMAAVAVSAVSEMAGLADYWRGVPILLAMGALALARPRLPIELPAAACGLLASAAALTALVEHPTYDDTLPLEVHLTVAGALLTASALVHPHRRLLGWPGGMLLVLASWVRLLDLGVDTPEAYTMPAAAALVLAGLSRVRRDGSATTLTALGPGLVLATVPSLLSVVAGDAVSWRALLLGLGCLALVLAGAWLRWQAPLVVGALVGAALVLWEIGPFAAELPPWLLIALAGVLLTVVGVTWEARMRDVRTASAYLARLR